MSRVIYEKNPLIEVILQIQFPTNLIISSNDPIEFQKQISSLFPNYQPEIQSEQEITFNPINSEVQSIYKNRNQKNHTFITKEGFSKITLTNSSISISTLRYTKWEDFFELFKQVADVFIKVYKPLYFERIGLRYIDAFKKKELGLEDTPWSELITQPWIGVLKDIQEKNVVLSSIDTEYKLDDNISRLKVHSGIGQLNNYSDSVFIIDSDFINISNIDISNWIAVSEKLHDYSDDFYQRTITDKLKKKLNPMPVE